MSLSFPHRSIFLPQSSFTFLPPPGSVCRALPHPPPPLRLFWFSFFFILRWAGWVDGWVVVGGSLSLSGWGSCQRDEHEPLFGSLLISLFLLLGDFHRGNPIRIRRGPAGEGALPGGVGCVCACVCASVCLCEFMAQGSCRMIDQIEAGLRFSLNRQEVQFKEVSVGIFALAQTTHLP